MDQNLAAPLTELEVLQANGCKVRHFKNMLKITHRPKPLLEQVGGQVVGLPNINTWSKVNPWIEFDGAGTTVQHLGVDG